MSCLLALLARWPYRSGGSDKSLRLRVRRRYVRATGSGVGETPGTMVMDEVGGTAVRAMIRFHTPFGGAHDSRARPARRLGF
ncbi:hypothetical protein GT037_000477 [Alternaria burnsii]|uniref:Uncharacterized protein n=1 Tax=Alternaria burnsii TaxID=1187904 RepID=A0A8H7EIM0_9PLEO|nr:uncharacterized protein GT037_000477 [Alternaria burnsii]KAF7681501.1 hypothetical protein GT037_000477 [Alternaria burnsii]